VIEALRPQHVSAGRSRPPLSQHAGRRPRVDRRRRRHSASYERRILPTTHGGGYGKDPSMYGLEDYTRIKHVMANIPP
jgi:hypothetical protein